MSESVVPTNQAFAIKTEVFEGPLELLLDLVEKRKLLINDISLAEVTDDYMKSVSLMQELSLPNTAQFVALAATLLLIKSKSLLPVLELTEEEESTIEDLEQRLKLYQIYRDAAKDIDSVFGKQMIHSRRFVPRTKIFFTPDQFCQKNEIEAAIDRVLVSLPKKEVKPKVQVKKVISLEEMIDRLHQRITTELKLKFSDLIGSDREKVNTIVGFLAVLESVKQGSVIVVQTTRFDEIEIERETTPLPRYQ